MPHAKNTFWLRSETLSRLREFSRRSGIPQSRLVDNLVVQGLKYLERRWSTEGIFAEAFGKRNGGRRAKAVPRRKAKRKVLA